MTNENNWPDVMPEGMTVTHIQPRKPARKPRTAVLKQLKKIRQQLSALSSKVTDIIGLLEDGR